MADKFGGYADSVSAPARRWAVITPNDGADLPDLPKAISNEGTAGTVTIVGEDGAEAAFFIAQGQERALRAKRVKATGMTAGMLLRALY